MSILRKERSRPAVNEAATPENIAGQATTIVSAATDSRHDSAPTFTATEVYEILRGRLAAHVITKDHADRVTCRSNVNLRDADEAVERAQAAGKVATVVMVRQDVTPALRRGGDPMRAATLPPVEHFAWTRGRIALCVRATATMGFDPHGGPSVVVGPLSTTGKPGNRADRSCDRCDYVPTGQLLFPVVIPPTRRVILVGGLCSGCLMLEAVSNR